MGGRNRANPRLGLHLGSMLGAALALAAATPVAAETVGRERDIPELRLGQRVMVDDGTCPAGQLKEILGAKMTSVGVARTSQCVPRFGPKKK